MNGEGIPMADGRTRKPKHVLGKRKPREYTAAGPCISYMPDGTITLFKPKRKPKPGRIGVYQNKNGEWIIKLRES